jgi:hypothetical protein
LLAFNLGVAAAFGQKVGGFEIHMGALAAVPIIHGVGGSRDKAECHQQSTSSPGNYNDYEIRKSFSVAER